MTAIARTPGMPVSDGLSIRSQLPRVGNIAASCSRTRNPGKTGGSGMPGGSDHQLPWRDVIRRQAAARLTVWSLTLPQVAATLAATLVGFATFDPAGRRLIDERVLNSVFVLMLSTSVLGPVLTQRYAPLMEQRASVKDGEDVRAA